MTDALKFNPDLLRKHLDKPDCRDYFRAKYSNVMVYYERFLERAGPTCSIVRSALQVLWAEEMDRNAESFQESLVTGKWEQEVGV